MGIIEQAARRLEELRRSGIDVASPGGVRGVDMPPRSASMPPAAVATAPSAVSDHRTDAASSHRVELDLRALEANGFVVPNGPRGRLVDEFRAIKRPLLANVRGESAAPIRRANCIMITSSVPGEGKTFTAINLALSMATEVDSRVLLIDADVLRPMVFERLGLGPDYKGLLDKLNEPELALTDLILRTNIEKLSLLPAGRADPHATELLASEAMRRVVDDLASRYADRIVIFDAPPLLAAPETRVLAAHVGQIIVIVEAQRTLQSTLAEALDLLEGCPVVMTLLNKATGPLRSNYGYGYGGYA